MPQERFFVRKVLEENVLVTIIDKELHHLVHVMRCNEGDTVELVNGQGRLAISLIQSIRKKQAELLVKKVRFENKSSFEIILAQAIPRMNRLDTILEKATELGVAKIWLFPGNLSERKKLTPDQLERARSVAVSALKQCGRLWLPEIEIKPALDKWTACSLPIFFGDLSEKAPPLITTLQTIKPKEGVIMVVGPESGFTSDEITKLRSISGLGVCLHKNILRTDTASLVSLGLISHWKLSDQDF